ncbi:DoxX family protein [Paradesertivirga mongoliensis]|uniref:DoxX family protein n=1 Tax=Paradesertivirga mongoliensis TaxID=2100740 RepID=A0ABW4ZP63_9SPHI|nr:DoxX family protein [Pedobacter mongoliensis]
MKNRILSYHPLNTDTAILLLRLVFGGLMAHHGYSKLIAYDQILPMFGDIIGIGSKLSFNLVIFAEFFCALFIVFGFLTRLSVIPIFITMVVAFFIAHGKDPFQTKELAFVFMTLSIVVSVAGSGRYSVDRFLFGGKDNY